jgi:hypothetical protein
VGGHGVIDIIDVKLRLVIRTCYRGVIFSWIRVCAGVFKVDLSEKDDVG